MTREHCRINEATEKRERHSPYYLIISVVKTPMIFFSYAHCILTNKELYNGVFFFWWWLLMCYLTLYSTDNSKLR
jgi:hypothetical protein